MENIFCIECEFELPFDANFCEKCGVPQDEDEEETESKISIYVFTPIFLIILSVIILLISG